VVVAEQPPSTNMPAKVTHSKPMLASVVWTLEVEWIFTLISGLG
jgi:hypothetical protein